MTYSLAGAPVRERPCEGAPEPGKYRFAKDSPYVYRRPPIDLCLEFCEANGIESKAHCLNYVEVGLFPTWVKGDVKREKELAPSYGRESS